MVFFLFLAKTKSFAHAIHKFQYNTYNKKIFCINSALHDFIDCIAATKLKNLLFLNVFKRKIKTVRSVFSCFYNIFQLINTDKFPKLVARFDKISANSQIIDFSIQQFITNTVMSAVATAIAAIQAKHKNMILFLHEIIKNSLLLRDFLSAIFFLDPDAVPKPHSAINFLPKALIKRWNQVNSSYFDLHLNRAYDKNEMVLVGKNIYYKNVIFFVQCFQSFVKF